MQNSGGRPGSVSSSNDKASLSVSAHLILKNYALWPFVSFVCAAALQGRASHSKSHYHTSKFKPKKPSGSLYALIGAGAGGCLRPALLLGLAAALGDTGGPLFWPLISIPLALIGPAIGLFVHSEVKSEDNHDA